MKKATLLLVLFSFYGLCLAQSVGNQSEIITTVKGTAVSVDPNGALYLLDGPILYKMSPKGEVIFKYCDFLLGDITSVDVDNPLKIMVYYYDAAKIVFLNDKLLPLMDEPLDLMAHNYLSVSLAAYSTDNTIWLYDAVLHDLFNVDFHLKELSRNHLTIEGLNPTQLLALQEKQLILLNPETGALIFDSFGTYLKTVPLRTKCSQIWADSSTIYYISSSDYETECHLCAYDYQMFSLSELISVPCSKCRHFAFHNGTLFYINADSQLNIIK